MIAMKSLRQETASTLLLLGALALALIINPVGFVGGGQDDAQYLSAARCWIAHGTCLPINHWQGRWPVFAPIALAIRVLGESRVSVQLWPLACSTAAVLLLSNLGQRLFNHRIGLLAGLLLIATPAFALQILTPSVEAIELALVLAGAVCVVGWRDQPNGGWAFAAGLCFGLAFQVRETSIGAAALTAGAIFTFGLRPKPAHLALALIGFALPLAIEFAIYQQATGDWLYRRHLSLMHSQIRSTELPASVDRTRSPILNPDFIGNWRKDPGVQIHWLVDGPVNLLLNGKAGFSLQLTPLLLLVGRNQLDFSTRRTAWWLLGFAAAYIAFIIYMLAMDPKPRVMLIALAASSLALALVATEMFNRGRKAIVIASLVSAAAAGVIVIASYVRPAWGERQARLWIARYPNAIEADRITRMILTFVPEARSLPDFKADRPYAMVMSLSNCSDWIKRSQLDQGLLEIAGEKRLSITADVTGSGAWICLFRYRQAVSPDRMDEALNMTWDGPK